MYPVNCKNTGCPINARCHRFMAEPKDDQVYETFKVTKKILTYGREKIVYGCDHFISMPDRVFNIYQVE